MTIRPNIASKVRVEKECCFNPMSASVSISSICKNPFNANTIPNPTGIADFTLSGDKETSRIARGESMSMRIPLRKHIVSASFLSCRVISLDRPSRTEYAMKVDPPNPGPRGIGRFEKTPPTTDAANVVNTNATAVFFSSNPLSFLFKS